MLLSPRKNGLTSLFKEVRVFKERKTDAQQKGVGIFFGWSVSTPNMTGRRVHRTMEVLPPSPGSLKRSFFPAL